MTSHLSFADRLALGFAALTAGATLLVYRDLPERIATHFDWHGHADSWQSRAIATTLLPAIGLVTWALVRLGAPRMAAGRSSSTVAALATATLGFTCTLHIALLGHALRPGLDVVRAVCFATGGLFALLGLLLPRVRQNAFVGVRTYWTLRSPEVWAKTQRVAGTMFFASGLVVAAAACVAPAYALAALLLCAVATSLTAFVYSWRVSERAA